VTLSAWPIAGACDRTTASRNIRIEWTFTPTPPAVGKARLALRLVDNANRPVRGAKLEVQGHMSHPGMAPLLARAVERDEGVYEAELQFTMPGDWILMISGALSNGASVEQRIDVPVAGGGENR
jgi:hypothetical protein